MLVAPRISLFFVAALTLATMLLAGCDDDSGRARTGVSAEPGATSARAADAAAASASGSTTGPASAAPPLGSASVAPLDPARPPAASASAATTAATGPRPSATASAAVPPSSVPAVPPTAPPPTATAAPPPDTTASPPSATAALPSTVSTAGPPPVRVDGPKLAPAKPGTADFVAEEVDAIFKPIGRFRAGFKQRYTAKIAGTTKNSSGTVAVERPGKLSFRYQDPNKNRVVSDGVTLKIYEQDNQQMFVRTVAGTEYPGALAFILGKGLRDNFTFSFNQKTKWEGGPVLVGEPRVPNPGYTKVLFYIDEALLRKGDPGCVRRVLVIDAQGNRNQFDFVAVERPASLPAGEFVFEPPPGTTLVK
jgi:outer membrane lipoprotein-sorting protein